jgi:hypothetical protein
MFKSAILMKCIKKFSLLFISLYASNLIGMYDNNKLFLDILPAELWWHIGTFLKGNDKALSFILQLFDLSSKQAIELIKRYIAQEQKDPLSFFWHLQISRNYTLIETEWEKIKNKIAQIKQDISCNKFNKIELYLKNEYNHLTSDVLKLQDISLVNKDTLQNKLESVSYALYTVQQLDDLVKNIRKRQAFTNYILSIRNISRGDALLGTIVYIVVLTNWSIGRYYSYKINTCKNELENEQKFNKQNFFDCMNQSSNVLDEIIITDVLLIVIPLTLVLYTKYLMKPNHPVGRRIELLINRYKNTLIESKNSLTQELLTR